MPAQPDVIAAALALRAWALRFLTHASADALPSSSVDAWRLFLGAEAIAWPLEQRLGAAAVAALPPDLRSELQRNARAELQRIMAARAELAWLDRMAAKAGVEPIILKGGVAVTDGSTGFDLGDVDVLLDTAGVQQFGRTLTGEGGYRYEASKWRFVRDDAFPVEVHDEIEVGYGVEELPAMRPQPLASFRALKRLDPVSHVLYMIQHSSTKHALRRGHLRDVLLIASALDRCSPGERAEVARVARASSMGDVYGATLALANATREGAPQPDVFKRIAAAKYAMAVWLPEGSPAKLPLLLDQIPHFVGDARDARRHILGYLGTDGIEQESRWYSKTLASVSPVLARGAATVIRTPYRVFALGVAAAYGSAIRWRYRTRWR